MSEKSAPVRDKDEAAGSAGAWPEALTLLARALRRSIWLILVLAALGAGLGVVARSALPPKFTATAQVMIDPRALQVFSNELVNSQLDANSAVNFVESQMQVLTSERVLTRVIAEERLAGEPGFRAPADAGPDDLRPSIEGERPPADVWALAALRRALTIKRQERSYIVDVTATARTAELAARIANAMVQSYIKEDAASRADAGRRLTNELTGRLSELREKLNRSETRVERFRLDNGLIAAGDKLVVDQKLAEAVTELGAAQGRAARAQARVDQLEKAARDVGSLGALTATEDVRTVSYLIERLSAARENLADLSLNYGVRHPALTSARSRVEEIESRLSGELGRIRSAARADLARAKGEQDSIARTVQTLSGDVSKSRQSQIELRALGQEVEANRALLASFETRSREADEFGRIAAVNLRVVSVALPPSTQGSLAMTALLAVAGGVLGAILGAMIATLGAFMSARPRARAAVETPSAPERPAPAEAKPSFAQRLGAARPAGGWPLRRKRAPAAPAPAPAPAQPATAPEPHIPPGMNVFRPRPEALRAG